MVILLFRNLAKSFLLGLDQVHKQNNVRIKGMGDAIPSLNKEHEYALARWCLCLHELTLMIERNTKVTMKQNSTQDVNDAIIQHHHEVTDAFKDRFSEDVNSLQYAMVSNLFKLETLTVLNQESA